jgi:hypothetical protein
MKNKTSFKKGIEHPLYGKHIDDKVKVKMSISHKNSKFDHGYWRNKKLLKTTKDKMKLAHLGPKNHFFGKKHSAEVRERMKLNSKGKSSGSKNWAWKGGITPLLMKLRRSQEYKLWRTAVFERDNYTCIWCGDDKGGNLEADHIQEFAYYPELRFAIDNGRTLCKKCHNQRHKNI